MGTNKEKNFSQMTDKVIIAKDGTETINAKTFKYATFPFEKFNPVQTSILPYITQDVNLVICTQTSSGKTVIAEMVASYEWYEKERTSLYIAPMRALAVEKITDWTNPKHHFSMLDMSICTGDFQITKQRINELNNAHIVILTPEMLAVRCRNMESEKSQFIQHAGAIIQDEAHILTCPNRGDAVEVLLMDVAKANPDARFVLLSATMTNAREIAEWTSKLNGKQTVLLVSNYRPVKLQVSYPVYDDKASGKHSKYKETESKKTHKVIEILQKHPNDKFLVFYHTKSAGYTAVKALKAVGVESVFFNADQSFEDKQTFLQRFMEGDLRVLLSTSSLAWGMNLPSKHVIVVGPYRGLAHVENYDIFQMFGRAGRPKYDTEGYVHMLLPKTKYDKWRDRLAQGTIVDSTFTISRPRPNEDSSDYYKRVAQQESEIENVIAHHLIAKVDNGYDTKEKLDDWFKETLAYHQRGEKSLYKLDTVINALTKTGLTKKIDDKLVTTRLGRIASLLYYPPFDVAGIYRNINSVIQGRKDKKNSKLLDADVAYIVSNVNTNARMFISDKDLEHMDYAIRVFACRYNFISDVILKPWYAWYQILQGDIEGYFGAYQNTLMQDAERTMAVLKMLDGAFKYGISEQLDVLSLRCKYGVGEHLVSLVKIPGIGRTYAIRLYDNNIRTYDDFIRASDKQLMECMRFKDPKKYQEFRELARELRNIT